jgi:3-oxoacyl-[acyl-carrier protein] reductase
MDLRLAGKTALVTGSSRGIGLAVARALAAEGARVALTGRAEADLQKAVAGIDEDTGRCLSLPGDCSTEKGAARAVRSALKAFGRLDILVCNLGSGRGKPGLEGDAAEWDRIVELNLFSAARAAKAALPAMRLAKTGSIVFVSSIASLQALGAPIAYEAAKAGLNALARGLSRDCAADGIRVNVVAPGNTFFPGGSWDEKLKKDRGAVEAMLARDVPQKRLGSAEEVAAAVAFVASPAASYMTGSCLVVDGGQVRAHSYA